jgi:hypothetical protein
MSNQNSRSQSNLVGRRAELLAELFFQELNPLFLSRPTRDCGYDLLVGFNNENAGINTFAVEVRATAQPLESYYPIRRSVFNRMAHSNVPGLLLVADVKRNRLYYAWLRASEMTGRGDTIAIPVVEINQRTREKLKKQFEAANSGVAAVG